MYSLLLYFIRVEVWKFNGIGNNYFSTFTPRMIPTDLPNVRAYEVEKKFGFIAKLCETPLTDKRKSPPIHRVHIVRIER